MKLRETGNRHQRLTHFHIRAKRSIEHPRRDLDDLTGLDLNPDDRPVSSFFASLMWETPAIMGMPSIMKFNVLPDMGRMTLRLR